MSILSRTEREILTSIVSSPLDFLAQFVKIPNKDRQLVPFAPWSAQLKLANALTGRDIHVKDSQCGSTSILSGLILVDTITHPNTTSVIMAHDEFTTGRLLHRVQVMYDSIPVEFKPELDHQSTYEKRFPDINSVIYISTARAAVAGRGEPIHNLLLSECAFYVEGANERIIIPALQRVPPEGNVYKESTPNGEDEILYPEVQDALGGKSSFALHTTFWWENPDNVVSSESKRCRPGDRGQIIRTAEELVLNGGRLTDDQLRFRRWKIAESGAMFWQEHLESLDNCFLTVGEPYYSPDVTLPITRQCYDAPGSGPGGARVWYPPEPGAFYVIGVDPGQGKQTESVCSVWRVWPDASRAEQHVATMSDMTESIEMAEPLIELAKYYNNALINPEANGHGVGLIAGIKNWPNLYWREDIVSGIKSAHIGWLTTGRTKPFMMQQLDRKLPFIETHDMELVRQIRGFRKYGLGRVVTTLADDHHDAACLALVAAINAHPSRKKGYIGSYAR